MSSFDFQTHTYGKWILAGEHAVLRGHGAIVFPILSKTFTLTYQHTLQAVTADFSGAHHHELPTLFWKVLEYGFQCLKRPFHPLTGAFSIENRIPIGVGMGASAALCVAVARWFSYQTWIQPERVWEFAKELEHLFHGTSSGLDIRGVSTEQGQYFQKGQIETMQATWKPVWLLSSCGQKSVTAECITTVNTLWEQNAPHAQRIDLDMAESVQLAKDALSLHADQTHALPLLQQSLQKAAACFESWGLINETLSTHMKKLLALGAIAVKPTGSGGGGYVLSLWNARPVEALHTAESNDWIWV